MTVPIVVAVLGALVLVVALGLWLTQRSRLVRSRVRDRVIVTLKSGAAFEGVLFAADREAWVLRSAQAFGAGENGSHVPVDGEILILAAEIDFAQRP